MRVYRRRVRAAVALCAVVLTGCSAIGVSRGRVEDPSFFPLAPQSHWEYVVRRGVPAQDFRFVATVKQDDFVANDGRACRIVDERYGDVVENDRVPVLYCAEGGFLHRVMSLEYRGDTLEDNGLRSGELRFLPTDLGHTETWEGLTNAYRLPDGSGFVVQQSHRAAVEVQPVVVPAGSFEECVRVDTTAIHYATDASGQPVGPRIVYHYADWYAAGVGLVKTEQRSTEARVLATIELVKYEIGKEPALR